MNLKTNNTDKNTIESIMDGETTGTDEEKQLLIDQFVCLSTTKGDNQGSIILESRMHHGQFISPGAFNARGLKLADVLNKNKLSGLEFAQRLYPFFKTCHNRVFIAHNAKYEEKTLINTKDWYGMTNYYDHKFQGNSLRDSLPTLRAYGGLKGLSFYNHNTKKYSLSQENISSTILSDDQRKTLPNLRHNALYDVPELKLLMENTRHPEIQNYLENYRDLEKRNEFLKNKIFFEFTFHYKKRYSTKLFFLIPDHPKFGSGWMNKVYLDTDHLFQENAETSVNLIKRNIKRFNNFKINDLNPIFPIGSKPFSENYPTCNQDELRINTIYKLLTEDPEFKFKLKSFWDNNQDKRKYNDFYNFKFDGAVSRYDQNISRLFHGTNDPNQKNKYADMFESPLLKKNTKRVMLYYFADYMNAKEKERIFEEEIFELNKKEASRVTYHECEIEFNELYEKVSSDERKNLEEYHQYIKALQADPGLLLGGSK